MGPQSIVGSHVAKHETYGRVVSCITVNTLGHPLAEPLYAVTYEVGDYDFRQALDQLHIIPSALVLQHIGKKRYSNLQCI